MSIAATAKYHNSDVWHALPLSESPKMMSVNHCRLSVTGGDCDGIVFLIINDSLTFTMGTPEARQLAKALIEAADIEDQKIDDDD